MKAIQSVFVMASFLFASSAQAQNFLQNVQSTAALDVTAPFSFDSSEENKLDIRSAELAFFGPLDPTFDAALNLAAHNEHGEFVAEVHEAYVSSSKLIPSSRFKVGKFFLGVGRLNQSHQHDWAFTSSPRVQKEFFDEEGIADSGAEFSTLLPTESFWDITVGVTNGYTYGHSHDEEAKPHVPTHYIHVLNFLDFSEAGALQWGLNYLGRTDAEAVQTQLFGLDFVFKQTEGKIINLLVQSEIWYRNQSAPEVSRKEELGAYIFPQFSLSERLFLGARIDLFTELSRTFPSDETKQNNFNYGVVPTLTYKHSEFTLFRVSYGYDVQAYENEGDIRQQKIELQLVSILGAHPAHSF